MDGGSHFYKFVDKRTLLTKNIKKEAVGLDQERTPRIDWIKPLMGLIPFSEIWRKSVVTTVTSRKKDPVGGARSYEFNEDNGNPKKTATLRLLGRVLQQCCRSTLYLDK